MTDNIEHIQYLPPNDLARRHIVSTINEALDRLERVQDFTLNDAVEIYEIRRYINEQDTNPTEQDQVNSLYGKACRFIRSLNSSEIAEQVHNLIIEYHTSFIRLLSEQTSLTDLDATIILPSLVESGFHLPTILSSDKLVKAWDKQVTALIVEDPLNGQLIIDALRVSTAEPEFHLPPSFANTEFNKLISRYIQHESAHVNYIEIIASRPKLKNSLTVSLDNITEARHRETLLFNEISDGGITIGQPVDVLFSTDFHEPFASRINGDTVVVEINPDLLRGDTSPITILDTFQITFGFGAHGGILTIPAKSWEDGLLESLGVRDRKAYPNNLYFRIRQDLCLHLTSIYREILLDSGVEIESAIEWFYSRHLPSAFDAPAFTFHPATPEASYLERTRHLFPELENLARQYHLFTQYGSVDYTKLEYVTVDYGSIPSLLTDKYFVPKRGGKLLDAAKAMFTKTFHLQEQGSTHPVASFAPTFPKVFTRESLNGAQSALIERLIDLDIIREYDGKYERNEDVLLALHYFKDYHAFPYHWFKGRDNSNAWLKEMLHLGHIEPKSHLLTNIESDYFDYCLNAKRFSNSLNLRNRYTHGFQGAASDETAYTDYVTVLMLIILLTIKINDDLRLYVDVCHRRQSDIRGNRR